MRLSGLWLFALALALAAGGACAAPMSRVQALGQLNQPEAATRRAAVDRLAEIGTMADAGRVLDALRDADPAVREAAHAAAWQIWSRSGDPKIDRLFARGVAQMQASALNEALATFDEIVRRRPGFAEGWNKRATVYYLLGDPHRSLSDCDEVFKRNPRHFGALSGAGQIHLQQGNLPQALDLFRRALEVHPNLEGPALWVPLIEQRLQQPAPNRI